MKFEEFIGIKENTDIKNVVYPIKNIKEKEDYVLLILEEEKIMISIETFFKYGIGKLKGLDENLYQTLKEDERLLKAYRGCLRKLSMRDHSIRQINDYLLKYGLNASEINTIIDKLKQYGLLDDDKYTQSRINYLNNSLISRKQIKTKLKKDGISDEMIEKYLDNDDEDYAKAVKTAQKYSQTQRNSSTRMKKQKVLTYLLNAGFSYENSKNAVDSLEIKSENELELLGKEYQKALKKYEKKYSDYELKQKIYAYLLNKGFNSDDIKTVMEG